MNFLKPELKEVRISDLSGSLLFLILNSRYEAKSEVGA